MCIASFSLSHRVYLIDVYQCLSVMNFQNKNDSKTLKKTQQKTKRIHVPLVTFSCIAIHKSVNNPDIKPPNSPNQCRKKKQANKNTCFLKVWETGVMGFEEMDIIENIKYNLLVLLATIEAKFTLFLTPFNTALYSMKVTTLSAFHLHLWPA